MKIATWLMVARRTSVICFGPEKEEKIFLGVFLTQQIITSNSQTKSIKKYRKYLNSPNQRLLHFFFPAHPKLENQPPFHSIYIKHQDLAKSI